MFFIVSTGRSGTKTMANVLSRVDGCICLHEPAPQLIRESSAYRYGTISEHELRGLLTETRSGRLDGSVYCESSQTLSLMIPVLVEAFPHARYIWLVRNGLDVVASAMQKQWYSGHSEHHNSYEDSTPIQKAWIDGRIEGHRCDDMSAEEWNTLDRFGKCSWYWGYVNSLIGADLDKYAAGRHFLLRLEHIKSQMPDLLHWMGLGMAASPQVTQHNLAKRPPYHWSRWTLQERTAFEHYGGQQMDRLYPEWRSPDGTWQGVSYQMPPNRNLWLYVSMAIKRSVRRFL